MMNAAAANEIKSNIGPDYSLAAELADWAAEQEEAEDVDLMTTAERQALNARMAEWFGC
jgi:hypothetical protein